MAPEQKYDQRLSRGMIEACNLSRNVDFAMCVWHCLLQYNINFPNTLHARMPLLKKTPVAEITVLLVKHDTTYAFAA